MPGYDPVRDAGGSDRSSPPANRHGENGPRLSPSSSMSMHIHPPSACQEDASAPRRSISRNSFDTYSDSHGTYGRHDSHDAGVAALSPRSAARETFLQSREQHRYAEHEYAPQRISHSPRTSMHVETSHPPRRSASIADLVAASEMSEAEHDRHREAHRWSHYPDESLPDHSMSRSSSASGNFLPSPAQPNHTSMYPRATSHHQRHPGHPERSPSMAHLLNDGTAGAIQDRPRSGSHSSVSSHVSHPPPHHYPSQMSPVAHPAGFPQALPATHVRDRLATAAAGSAPYYVHSPTSAYPQGMHPLNTLNRGGSSPGLGTVHSAPPPVDRARYASQGGSLGHAPLPRSGSNSYTIASASSSPASSAHAHLLPSPSHRFAVPEAPFVRSPEPRRVPLPQSPTSAHSAHPRASFGHTAAPSWNGDDYESSAPGMPPPPLTASPRRGSLANPIAASYRQAPTTPGYAAPPTPGSVTSFGGYPVTPGARSVPSTTPISAYPRRANDGHDEANYFPRMEAQVSNSNEQARERSSSLTSPHLRQIDTARRSHSEYDPVSDSYRGHREGSANVPTPGSAHPPVGLGRSSMQPPPSLPASAPSPSFGPQRRVQQISEEQDSSPTGRDCGSNEASDLSADRRYGRKDSPTFETSRPPSEGHQSDRDARRPASRQSSHRTDARQISPRHLSTDHVPAHTLSPRDLAKDKYAESENIGTASDADSDHSERPPGHEAKIKVETQPSEGSVAAANEELASDTIRPLPRYAPTRRVSKPREVMQPIGIEEIDQKRARCRNPLRREWERQNMADSRKALDDILRDFHGKLAAQPRDTGVSTGSDARKRAIGDTLEDAEEVADHYNKRREVGVHGREESPIIALRKFNNWIKSVLVGQFARGRDPSKDGRARPRGGRVLDLGCGKGGDLKKWEKVQPSGMVGADIAAVSIDQAIARHRENKHGYPGDFFAFDCFSLPLDEVVPRELLEPMFDNVTLQFCMHYAWESVEKARVMLDNVSRYLRQGGIFIGTIPDSRELRDRMAHSRHSEDRSFGNRYYKVMFDQIETFPAFGNRYTFFLEDAVENVPEYVVDFDVFEELAQEVGLRCIYRKNFAEIYHEGSRHHEYGRLLERMSVVDRHGSLKLDEEMWQAATLYLGFAFEKM